MSMLATWWQKICVPLDGFLWHQDISHPVIRPLLRNQILACGATLLTGAAIYVVFPWLFWFACGLTCISWIFWSWARVFASMGRTPSLGLILLKFLTRLAVLAFLLLVALAWCHAPASAILAGLVAGSLLGLATFAWKTFHDGLN